MPSPSLASASVSVSGGAIRSVCPYRPPLPISSPRSLVASSIFAASGGLGFSVAGSTRSNANIRPLPRTSPTMAVFLVASFRPSMMIRPVTAALRCRSWEST